MIFRQVVRDSGEERRGRGTSTRDFVGSDETANVVGATEAASHGGRGNDRADEEIASMSTRSVLRYSPRKRSAKELWRISGRKVETRGTKGPTDEEEGRGDGGRGGECSAKRIKEKEEGKGGGGVEE